MSVTKRKKPRRAKRAAPKRRATAKRRVAPKRRTAVKRGATAKGARKRSAAKKRTTARRTAKRRAAPKRRATPKRATGRPAAAKRSVRRAPRKRSASSSAKLRLVRRPAKPRRRAPAPPAFQQTAGASPKQRLLFDLMRARTAVLAAVQGMTAGSAEQPFAAGKWNTRRTLLHLITRDRIRIREMEATLRGIEPSWRTISEDEQSAINARDLAELEHLPWDDVLRLLQSTRQELLESIELLPDEPSAIWDESHPFGWMMLRLPNHDRHHAEAIKRWRATSQT
ncbi:MAG TPA: DinB family protein [Candidatus Saccharimonadaceae bacterium]|jgi:uncharacterized damage-inducible protein DinB|nr:DinB family protein [Candidatus Saccharimonadaceae bacterium]